MKNTTKKKPALFTRIIKWLGIVHLQISAAGTFFFSVLSLIIVAISLIISIQSYGISEIAIKQSSSATEPLLTFDIDCRNDTVNVKNETSSIFQIYHVNFGRIQTIAILETDNYDKFSIIALEDRVQSMNLEHGHTTGTDTSDEDAKKFNKSFDLSLADVNDSQWAMWTNNTEFIKRLEEKVIELCDRDNMYEYLDKSPSYDYRFIEIYYMDAYKNRSAQYYIYKYEYSSSWRLYKLSEQEYLKYVEDVMIINTNNEDEEKKLIDVLFNPNNLINVDGTKYQTVDFNAPKYESNKINN